MVLRGVVVPTQKAINVMSKRERWQLLALAAVGGVMAFAGAYLGWYWLMASGILLVPVLYLPWRTGSRRAA
jgi:zinc transporter ZupT